MRIDVRQGLNVELGNDPEQLVSGRIDSARAALLIDNYIDLDPILSVAEGDRVALGQRLFVDRRNPDIAFTAPMPGVVVAIERSAKRRIRKVVIERNGTDAVAYPQHNAADVSGLTRSRIQQILLESGAWTAIRARPFNCIASPKIQPRALFVTAIDTNPLAPDPAVILKGRKEEFDVGLAALELLCAGHTYVCVAPDTASLALNTGRAQVVEFGGPHPAGLAGTHMHAVGPEITSTPDIWHIGYQDTIAIGSLLLSGRVSPDRVISVAGPAAQRPRLVQVCLGAETSALSNETCSPHYQALSGSPLVANKHAQYLGRYDYQLTLIPLSAGIDDKKRSWPARLAEWLTKPLNRSSVDSAVNGWFSGMLPVESFECVWPFTSPPGALLRALLADDIDTAIDLGCLGLAEEDLALCEFVCPAKQDYATALRAMLRKAEVAT